MKKATKLLLTIPSIIGFAYLATFFSIDFFKWVTNTIIDFKYQAPVVNGLTILQIGFLIYRVWTFKSLPKSKKTNWTVLLIIFNFITSLIYLWKKDDDFEAENNALQQSTIN